MQRVRDDANSALVRSAAIMKHFYDRHHAQAPDYQPGDQVWLEATHISSNRPSKKLDDRRFGPFSVLQKVGQRAYQLQLPASWKIHPVFHTSLLRPYRPPTTAIQHRPLPPPPILVGDHLEQEVEAVLDERHRRGRIEYLVKWKNLPREENTWEPRSHLDDESGITDAFQRYLQQRSTGTIAFNRGAILMSYFSFDLLFSSVRRSRLLTEFGRPDFSLGVMPAFRAPQIDLQSLLSQQNPHINLSLDVYKESTRNFLKAVSNYKSRAIAAISERHEHQAAERKKYDAELAFAAFQRQLASLHDKCSGIHAEIEHYHAGVASLQREKDNDRATLNTFAARAAAELAACDNNLRCAFEGIEKDRILIRFFCLNPVDPEQECNLVLDASSTLYKVITSSPSLPSMPILVDTLNNTNGIFQFIINVRTAFKNLFSTDS
ncbi:hypothetical protein APHAL10511_003844 [Amanita phalloides]|nr:hypothetical protein APHAL10511_003844 [Amanita phalloides]